MRQRSRSIASSTESTTKSKVGGAGVKGKGKSMARKRAHVANKAVQEAALMRLAVSTPAVQTFESASARLDSPVLSATSPLTVSPTMTRIGMLSLPWSIA